MVGPMTGLGTAVGMAVGRDIRGRVSSGAAPADKGRRQWASAATGSFWPARGGAERLRGIICGEGQRTGEGRVEVKAIRELPPVPNQLKHVFHTAIFPTLVPGGPQQRAHAGGAHTLYTHHPRARRRLPCRRHSFRWPAPPIRRVSFGTREEAPDSRK